MCARVGLAVFGCVWLELVQPVGCPEWQGGCVALWPVARCPVANGSKPPTHLPSLPLFQPTNQIEAERGLVLAEERSNIERLLTAISGTLNRDLPARLAEAVRGELAGLGDSLAAAVAPAVQGALAGTLPKEVGSAVRAGLDKQLGSAVAAGLAGKPLQDAVRTAFSKQLVPAVEAATQAAFQQINAALTTGFEEHLQVGVCGWWVV